MHVALSRCRHNGGWGCSGGNRHVSEFWDSRCLSLTPTLLLWKVRNNKLTHEGCLERKIITNVDWIQNETLSQIKMSSFNMMVETREFFPSVVSNVLIQETRPFSLPCLAPLLFFLPVLLHSFKRCICYFMGAYLCTVPVEARRGYQLTRNWDRCHVAQRLELWSSGREASACDHWAISSAPSSLSFRF
jgi:hypothetical protein